MTTRQKLLLFSLSFLLVLLCIPGAFSFYLPIYLETKLIPQYARKAGLDGFDCDVRSVGLYGLDIGGLSMPGGDRNGLKIGSVRLDYSPVGLFKKHIDTIIIDGVKLPIALEDGKVVIPGLSPLNSSPAPSASVQAQSSGSRLRFPVSIGSIRIHHGLLRFSSAGNHHNIPFNMQLSSAADGQKQNVEKLKGTVRLYPGNLEMLLRAKADLAAGKFSINFSCNAFRLTELFDLAGIRPVPQLDAFLDAHINAVVRQSQGGFESTGFFGATIKNTQESELSVAQPITLLTVFKAGYADSGEWHFEIASEENKQQKASENTIAMEYGDLKFISQQLQIVFSCKGAKQTGEAAYTIRLPRLKVSSNAGALYVPMTILKGKVDFAGGAPNGKDLTATLNCMTERLEFNSKDRDVAVHGDISFAGNAYHNRQGATGLTGLVSISKANFSHETLQLEADGIQGKLPLQWPVRSNFDKGSFQMEKISRASAMFGFVSGRIWQNSAGLAISGEHKNILVPGLSLEFKGKTNFTEKGIVGGLNFNVPRFRAEGVELERILPAAKKMAFDGELELAGGISFESGKIEGSIDTNIYNGTLMMQEHDIIFEGVRLALPFPDLPTIHSGPALLEYKKASFGEMTFQDGRIVFQIESPQSLLLEQSGFRWCGGHVYTHAIRVTPKEKNYDITMYCDRLNLADVLKQFGITDTKGEGTVNGRIPLRYENEAFFFDDGFLYSTPGVGGTIRVAATDMLTAGLPKNSPQYAQLDFAGAALKDFKYNWAKVQLNTIGNDAILQLRLDGKPAKPLPFAYHKELGGFARIEAESKGGIQHPILLDINFRLPIDEILGYAGKAKGFYRMTQ